MLSGVSSLSAIGGIVVAHLLTRSWQHRQWLLDNRKNEARELLTALAESYTALMRLRPATVLPAEIEKLIEDSADQAIRCIADRIFLASAMQREDVLRRWVAAMTDFHRELEPFALRREYEALRGIVLSQALEPK